MFIYLLYHFFELNAEYAILLYMEKTSFTNNLIKLDCVDSTNEEAFRRAKDIKDYRLAVSSLSQSAGRGRLGRQFLSEESKGIFLSVLENEILNPQITARAAVCVCKVLEEASGISLKIKWPNDIVVDGKKLCGILTEMRNSNVVIGIGINLYNEDFGELTDIATSLRLCGYEADREDLLTRLLIALDNMLDSYEKSKPGDLDYYKVHSCVLDKDIYLISGDEKNPAKAVGLSEDFELIVSDDNNHLRTISSGEVSLRLRT